MPTTTKHNIQFSGSYLCNLPRRHLHLEELRDLLPPQVCLCHLGALLAILRVKCDIAKDRAWLGIRNFLFDLDSWHLRDVKVVGFEVILGPFGVFFEQFGVIFCPLGVIFGTFGSFFKPNKFGHFSFIYVRLHNTGDFDVDPGGNCIKIGLPGKLIRSKRKGLQEVLFSLK